MTMTRTSTRILLVVLLLVAAGGVGLFVAHGNTQAAKAASGAPAASGSAADRVVPVATATAQKKDVPVVLEGLGTVTPIAMVTVKTQVDGRLNAVAFKEGQSVKKGDLIAQVDPRPFQIQLQNGEASLYRDDAQLKNGKLNLDRYDSLRKQNLIPQQQVDDQRTAVDQLEAATRTDQATIASARLNLDYARIVSPIDGVTGIRLVDSGNVVHATDPGGIVVITQLDPIAVVFTLPQDELPRVQKALNAGKVGIEAFARDGIQKLGAGELMLVDNQVNVQTATIKLKASVPNPERLLWPNGFVKARITLATLKDALVVPASVVQRGPNGTFAYVVNADKTVAQRNLEVGSIEGDLAVITKGLAEGDVVVTDGQNQLRPGGKVAPRAAVPTTKTAQPIDSAKPAPSGAHS